MGYLPCDQGEKASNGTSLCKFEVPPTTPFTWDPSCAGGVPGCSADGEHLQCRFCGGHPFLPCPVSKKDDNWCHGDVEPGSHCPTTTETSTTTTTGSTTSTQTTTTMTSTSSTSTSPSSLRGSGLRPWLATSVQCAFVLGVAVATPLHELL